MYRGSAGIDALSIISVQFDIEPCPWLFRAVPRDFCVGESLWQFFFRTVFTQQKSTFKIQPLLPLCNRRLFCAWGLVIYALKLFSILAMDIAESYLAKHELLCACSAAFSVISPGSRARAFYSCSLFEYVEIVQKRCVPTRESLLGQISAEGWGGGGGGGRRGGTAFPHFGHCQIIISRS